ncbi:DUF5678 domain-containing protein [Thermodesulfobacteriota bacterium]
MKSILMLKDSKKHAGEYVATKSFSDNKIIAHGLNIATVHRDANEKGVDEPFIFFVPQKEMIHIY